MTRVVPRWWLYWIKVFNFERHKSQHLLRREKTIFVNCSSVTSHLQPPSRWSPPSVSPLQSNKTESVIKNILQGDCRVIKIYWTGCDLWNVFLSPLKHLLQWGFVLICADVVSGLWHLNVTKYDFWYNCTTSSHQRHDLELNSKCNQTKGEPDFDGIETLSFQQTPVC